MIVIDLRCDQGHRFEGWFASAEAFRQQCQRQQVLCPQCQTANVSQLPSAPHLSRGAPEQAPSEGAQATILARMQEALATIARKAENVGRRFPEEARRIHYDEAPARTIRGTATLEETRELLEEGIAVLPAPVPPEDKIH